ncbi:MULTISPECIES: hypothetical protein [Paenibacillus]|uniref:Uncharacterized protein n=1 Tax=Paenibacillus albilobatus TaxID=2716884 RepID=A0A920CAI1_9BACL|nr:MULTISPECIES: hypothetical protein [Paenibacillus]GIO30928.1 hypothetical protein J2TS6_20690 [Paenibacillus albilobatus]
MAFYTIRVAKLTPAYLHNTPQEKVEIRAASDAYRVSFHDTKKERLLSGRTSPFPFGIFASMDTNEKPLT